MQGNCAGCNPCRPFSPLAAQGRLWSDPPPVIRRAFTSWHSTISRPNWPEDRHELYLQIREKLNEMRAFGMPLPQDLVEFERDLEAQFKAEERGTKKS
jgi:hypothetical protein